MNRLIYNTFVKDPENIKDPKVRENYGKVAGIIGILTNTCLFAFKFFAGIISGSIAIIADGLNNLSDASSSIITFVGFKLSAKPEDKEHPYGHARLEYITGNIIAVIIVVMGVELFRTSLEKTINPSPIVFSTTALLIVIISIPVKMLLSSFYNYGSKKIGSISLKVSAMDSLLDVLATTFALASLVLYKLTGFLVDGPMGIMVSLFIIFSGIQMIKETVSPLLGEAPDSELVQQIKKNVLSHKGILGIHDLFIHSYGPGKTFVTLHAEVDADTSLVEAHFLIDTIEREIKRTMDLDITIHLDPLDVKNPDLLTFSREAMELTESLPGVSHMHDIHFVKSEDHTIIQFDLYLSQDCKLSQEEVLSEYQKIANQFDGDFRVDIDFGNSCTDI